MIAISRSVRVYAYARAVDLRNGYNGLYGLVKNELAHDPLSGDLYLFVNARRTSCKVLLWDGTGLCIFQKRLERGRFASVWSTESKDVRLTVSELGLFIEGCTFVGKHRLSPREIVPIPLANDARV